MGGKKKHTETIQSLHFPPHLLTFKCQLLSQLKQLLQTNSILIAPLNPDTHLELSVALCVFEHVQEELCTLLGPTALSPVKLLGLKTHTQPSC